MDHTYNYLILQNILLFNNNKKVFYDASFGESHQLITKRLFRPLLKAFLVDQAV